MRNTTETSDLYTTPSSLFIEMFGGLRVRHGDRLPVEFPPQLTSTLLACLALEPHKNHLREELIERLWPDGDPEEGHARLRQLLWTLRRQIEPPPLEKAGLLRATRTHVQLNWECVRTDVQEFEAALDAASRALDPQERRNQLELAVTLARGELLPGFYLESILSERNRLSTLRAACLRDLAHAYEQTGDLPQAIEYGLRSMKADPLHESNYVVVMRLYAAAGQPIEALRQYGELERLLKAHLNAMPSSEIRELAERLRADAPASGKPPTVSSAAPQTFSALSVPTNGTSDYKPEPPAILPIIVPSTLAPPRKRARPVAILERFCRLTAIPAILALLGWYFWPARSPATSTPAAPAPAAKAVLHGIPAGTIPLASQKIAFESQRDGPFHIFRMNADGAHVTRLTNTPAPDLHPSVSPDGKKIAFVRIQGGSVNIYSVDADGSHVHPLTHGVGSNDVPAWSPDGRHIAFTSMRDGNYQIYVMNADGSEQRRVTQTLNSLRVPCWSPDSQRIAFMEGVGINDIISVVDLDGSHPRALTKVEGASLDVYPAWSPDGKHIAFVSNRNLRQDRSNLYVMDADGRHIVQVTDNLECVQCPAWSPDGAWIAFMSDRTSDYELYALHPGDKQPLRLTYCKGQDSHASWFPVPASSAR